MGRAVLSLAPIRRLLIGPESFARAVAIRRHGSALKASLRITIRPQAALASDSVGCSVECPAERNGKMHVLCCRESHLIKRGRPKLRRDPGLTYNGAPRL